MVSLFTQVEAVTKVSGSMEKLRELADSTIKMVICMLGLTETTRLMAMGHISTSLRGPSTSVTTTMISLREKGRKFGLMEQLSKEIIEMVRRVELECFYGQISQNSQATSKVI